MSSSRATIALAVLLSVLWTQPAPGEPGGAKAGAPTAERDRRTDRHGDALPPGALVRFGTERLRHTESVEFVAFTPDGKTAISGARGMGGHERDAICFWDPATGRLLRSLVVSSGALHLALSPGGRRLAYYDSDNCIVVWDLAAGTPARRLNAPREGPLDCLAFSPDGNTLACTGLDAEIELWDVAAGRLLRRLDKMARAIAYTRSGKHLVTLTERELALWDVKGDDEVWWLGTQPDSCHALALSPDGKLVAVGTGSGRIELFSLDSGKQVGQTLKHDSVSAVAFSPDGKLLAYGEGLGSIRLWDVQEQTTVRELQGHRGVVTALAFSPDGKTLLSGSTDQSVRLWDVTTGRERVPPGGHEDIVDDLALAPDGKTLASASRDGTLRLWERVTGRQVWQVEVRNGCVGSVAFSPDGRTLASGDEEAIRLCDAGSGTELRRLRAPGKGIYRVAFSPDGALLASVTADGPICLWHVSTGKELRRLEGGPSGYWESPLAFAPDGRALAWTEPDRGAFVSEVATGKVVRRIRMPDRWVRAVAFSPDGGMLATGDDDDTVTLWDLGHGKERLRLTGHDGEVLSVGFAPDGRTLISGGKDGTVRVWEVATGQELRCFRGHRDEVRGVAFAPDGRVAASASGDFTLLLWDVTGASSVDGRLIAHALTEEQLAACWESLAGRAAPRAYGAVWSLAAAGDQAVRFLATRLAPVPADAQERIDRWIRALDDDDFSVRDKATRELEAFGALAEPALRKALRQRPADELRKRATALLETIAAPVPPPHRLREIRALAVLEHVGTADARYVLQSLARGAPQAPLTREARAVLNRLSRHPAADR